MTGAVPDRRQDERACPHCDGSGIRQFDSDGYEACRCLLPAVSPVPGQQREAAPRFAIVGEWLAEEVGEHTCGTGRDDHYGAHEPGCGLVPVCTLADLARRLAPPSDQQREAVADLLLRHWRTPTSGCECGGVPLGHSWPLHVADELLALLAATRDGEQA